MNEKASIEEGITIPADVVARVQKDFGGGSDAAFKLLRGDFPEVDRVLRCIVYLAKGDITALPELIAAAATDYRDVIFWAEYTDHEARRPHKVRDLNKPFPTMGDAEIYVDVGRSKRKRR